MGKKLKSKKSMLRSINKQCGESEESVLKKRRKAMVESIHKKEGYNNNNNNTWQAYHH